jgi:hypothetical protein
MNSSTKLSLLIAASAIAGRVATVDAALSQSFAVFGNTGVTYDGFSTTSGAVGSNGDINDLAASTTITSMSALGNFNGSGDAQTVTGAMDFNGNFIGGGLSSYGAVDAGGDVSLQGNVLGNLTVGHNLTMATFNSVADNALVGGNANLSGSNTVGDTLGVNGNVSVGAFSKIYNLIYGGTLTTGSGSTVTSQSPGSVLVQPKVVSPVILPMPTATTSSGPTETLPTFANVTLSPGHYGALTFNGSNQVTFTAGNYYFASIQSAGDFTTLNFDLHNGPINIFVAGGVDLLAVSETVNGVSFSAADPTLASEVYLQAGGPVAFDNVSPANGSTFFGTIYAPYNSISMGVNETVTGALLSGQSVTLAGTNVAYEPSTYLAALPLPEPASLSSAALAGSFFLRRRRRGARSLRCIAV